MDPPPPHSSSSSSYTSFPILAITILGILTTSILLLSYYLFLTRCRLSSSASASAAAARAPPALLLLPPAEPRGLDPYIISILPIVKFSPPSAVQECAICLAETEPRGGGCALKLLPACSHAFHIDCVDTWLQTSTSCPLCRTAVTAPFEHRPIQHRERDHLQGKNWARSTKHKIGGSMGDECINVAREKDESFDVQQPMRRSLSMDSSSDRQLILSVRETLQEKQLISRGEGSSTAGGGGGGVGSGWVRRPFFSFGSGRSSRSAILPVDIV